MDRDEPRIRENLRSYLDALDWYNQCLWRTNNAKGSVEYYKQMLIEAGGTKELEKMNLG